MTRSDAVTHSRNIYMCVVYTLGIDWIRLDYFLHKEKGVCMLEVRGADEAVVQSKDGGDR